MKLTKFLPILAMLFVVSLVGCKKDADPGIRPTVLSTDPVNNAVNSPLNGKISVTFSAAMDPSTVTAAQFGIKQGTTAVEGTVAFAGTVAVFTPAASLSPNTIYTGTISNGVKNTSGTNMAKDYVWTFTSGATPDVTAPTIMLTSPSNNATSVALNTSLVITFSEPLDATTVSGNTVTLKQGSTLIAGSIAYLDSKITFMPASSLAANTLYNLTVTTGVKDRSGNALASNSTINFTTDVAPTVALTVPANAATGVALNQLVVITFSKAMNAATISTSTITVKQGLNTVAGAIVYTGTAATFTPTSALLASTVYTVTVTTGAKDVLGTPLAANSSISFTTASGPGPGLTLPMVNATDPLNNATGVSTNKVLAITFSKPMDPLTITSSTFTLAQGLTPVAGAAVGSGSNATFTPTNILAGNTVYTATITTGAKDLAGNALASSTVWSFTTAAGAPTLAVVNLRTSGNYVILAKTFISNVPTSAITGDLGLSPAATSFITGFGLTNATGFATAPEVTGQLFAADMATPTDINLTTAVNDMQTAYVDAAGRSNPDFLELGTGNIGGMTLTPGLYKWAGTVTMPSSITISGSATDVWIFQIAGDLIMSNSVNITLIGGALPQNIFWQVAGQSTFGTTSHFEGIVLCATGITLQTGASMKGRALAQTGVALDKNTVVKPN